LNLSLNSQGYRKATGIIELEAVLRTVEGRGPDDTYRDPGKYYFTFFGEPSGNRVWGWRLDGHHLSFNFSSMNNELTASVPAFMGSNPAKIISDKAPYDIITEAGREADIGPPVGLTYAEMNGDQKLVFGQLVDVYLKNYRDQVTNALLAKLNSGGINELHFAWAGSLQPGSGHYYRIHGLSLLIEFDNTQNNANHIHSVVRDLENDFGGDLLRKHYEESHRHGTGE
jgi:hypothetical protein